MRNKEIHGRYTIYDYCIYNDIIIAYGIDQYLDTYYRLTFSIDIDFLGFNELENYYKNVNDLVAELTDTLRRIDSFEQHSCNLVDEDIKEGIKKIIKLVPVVFI